MCKPKTVAGYRSLLDRHVLPAFGRFELRQITTQAVRRWLADLQAQGLSPSRVRQAYLVLSGSLDAAVDDDRLARNPARVARKDVPADRTREMRWLDHDEVDCLVAAVDEQWQTLLVTLAYTGLRWGEAAALRRGRCHLLRRQLHVVESLSEVGGDLTFAEPKSRKSVRWVHLPEFLVEQLAAHLRQRVPDDPDALVFTSPEGAPLRHSNFYKRVWRPAVEAARLPDGIRIHDLRHSAASFMARAGYPLDWVGKQLGHSSITVTEQYRHFYPEQGAQLAGLLDAEYRAAQQSVGVSLGSRRGEVVELTGS